MTALVLLVTVLAVTFGVRDMLRREREHLEAVLRRRDWQEDDRA